jgi:(p)ppGpp synthase/HD superfamily hydrolase
MTKIEQFERDKSINTQNIDKFVTALSTDIRVLRLKMVDRGVNLEDAEQLSAESRERNCREALDLYVPLGWLCGFGKAARHLSDIALKKISPERYLEVSKSIKEMLERDEALLIDLRIEIVRKFNEVVTQELPPEIINTMEGRSYLERKKAGLQVLTQLQPPEGGRLLVVLRKLKLPLKNP